MTENDKKLMNGCYMAEIRTNALDAKPSTAKGFIRGYEKAFSLHVVSQQREQLIDFCAKLELKAKQYSYLIPDEDFIDEYLKDN